ncbi:fatty acid cis/trans isomerase [Halobacteriovorax sp. RZ-1]|uniref:fatty acid cis/trans isomerase n=1 Tax=unclassified Halobacteriovorax TaxID=2639665 RepID=UPI00371BEBC3
MKALSLFTLISILLFSCSNSNDLETLTPKDQVIHQEATKKALKKIANEEVVFTQQQANHWNGKKKVDFNKDVKPIFDNRCVVCHSCYDSPCQLKLTSKEAIQRGASKNKVYMGERLVASSPSRLYIDATSTKQWRDKGFFSVSSKHMNESVMAKMLKLKEIAPLPKTKLLPSSLDFSLENDRFCPKKDEFEDYAQASPFGGMPYGLPALSDKESKTITTWIAQGSKFNKDLPLPKFDKKQIRRWEKFLNKDSKKGQLMARYLYEHLYLANLHFSNKANSNFYKLVRSKTPSGKPVEIIATRRPFDDPKVKRVYYRLVKQKETIVDKTHMPYLFNQERMNWYSNLFLKPKYSVKELPSYRPHISANPFLSFKDLPVQSRYEFLLKESQYTISNFIKGPVCRGQIALNVIQDHFWVFFINPKLYHDRKSFPLTNELERMSLPAQYANAGGIQWFKYKNEEEKYLEKKSKFIDENHNILNLNSLWNGGKNNQNAALTIFRHFDSATVLKGMVGQNPKTAWIIDYPLLERIHYLLVAGFDVYGNVSHQLNTRLYMDFLRLEGEFNFLTLLPSKQRIKERDHWYERASDEVKKHIVGRYAWINKAPQISYKTKDAKSELFELIKKRIGPSLNKEYQVHNEGLQSLMNNQEMKHTSVNLFSQLSFILVEDTNETYTLIHNNAHYNISHLLKEGSQRITQEDNFTVTKGTIGSYPNTIFRMKESQIPNFVNAIKNTKSEASYSRLLDRYGVRRSDKRFWPTLDKIHDIALKTKPIEFGLYDLNRLENR